MKAKKLEDWVKKLEHAQLPIMGKTVDVLRTAEQFVQAHASKLTGTILQDTNMTASILKLANSALYSRNNKISTVSRAILTLGFEAIRSICISSLVLDSITKKSSPYLQQSVAYSFQSAVQAKLLAIEKGERKPETIYIAALLYNLGEIAFWSSSDPLTFKMHEAIHNGSNFEDAQKQVLGFSFNKLTLAMTQDWKLSDVLSEALGATVKEGSNAQLVTMSNELVRELPNGWEQPKVVDWLDKASKLLDCKYERVNEVIHTASETTITTLRKLGLKQASSYIPLPPKSKIKKHDPKLIQMSQTGFIKEQQKQQSSNKKNKILPSSIQPPMQEQQQQSIALNKSQGNGIDVGGEKRNKAGTVEPIEQAVNYLKPNTKLQMSILSDLSKLASEKKIDVNVVLQLVLEGMYKGMGMDRALISLMIPSKDLLVSKYLVQLKESDLKRTFKYSLTDVKKEPLLLQVINHRKVVSNIAHSGNNATGCDLITSSLGVKQFIAGPLVMKEKCVGIFYTDRQLSGRMITQQSIESFKIFVSQATLCLQRIGK